MCHSLRSDTCHSLRNQDLLFLCRVRVIDNGFENERLIVAFRKMTFQISKTYNDIALGSKIKFINFSVGVPNAFFI